MVRYWAIALLALAPMAGVAQAGGKKDDKKDPDVKIEGKLTKDDPLDRKRNTPSKIHLVKLKGGKAYTIDMKSTQFDSYLRLEDPKGNELAEDDDSGGDLNAQIVFNCPADGEYKIVTMTFGPQMAGAYTLTVKMAGGVQQVATSHSLLVGKAAPDLQADFALNGQARKLADLKNKVVLLAFWDIRSGPCASTFPKLNAWQKAHKAAGLEIVGVSFYTFEIGQKLGFDKKTGQLKAVPQANKESEQQLLKEFAAYHKLDYQLLVLSMAEALKVFDAYTVNGLPQFVLIDRKGMVRAIRVGEGDGMVAALEPEIKKLLAEK
ncbi:MAG TPA: redoxin domain-containing protein [Gemmataceae bacterium]|nr:redoxin domain-containing protein [Gemmataceae bacterium]